MISWKAYILCAVVVMAAGFGYIESSHRNIQSDLRDAVADNRKFDTSLPVFDKDRGNIPESAAVMGTRFAHKRTPAAPVPVSAKEWTVLVYMNGKNSLEFPLLINVNMMETVGSNSALNIVVEAGRTNNQEGDVAMDGDWTGSHRYYVTKDENMTVVSSKILQSFGRVDMGDWRHLVDFAKWGKENYPARHYMLLIWNHGSGWLTTKDVSPTLYSGKGISYDDETNNHISIPELAAAMRAIGRVDILAFDACLMQMAEVLYELRDSADYIVGAEEYMDEFGFPYQEILTAFSSGSEDSRVLAAEMVRLYSETPRFQQSETQTISAVNMSAMPEFITAFNAWMDAILASGMKPQFKGKYYSIRRYDYEDNKDLYDLLRVASGTDPGVSQKSRALMDIIDRKLVLLTKAVRYYSPDPASHGVAIYLPFKTYNNKYDQLAFAKDTRWADFLKVMAATKVSGIECILQSLTINSLMPLRDYRKCEDNVFQLE
ncbi:MAG TPA: hypothetical protein DCL44_01815 [Elusimicrobia bacterium]|nr:hypothetical protein [Elusimicrobiota bacterium]